MSIAVVETASLMSGSCQPVRGTSVKELLGSLLCVGFVDPRGRRQPRRLGKLADEPLGMGGIGSSEHLGSGRLDLLGPAVVDVCGGQQADSGVVVLDVVPGEEVLAEDAGVLDGTEVVGEGGPVLEGLELGLGVRIVVGHVRAGVALGD